MPVYRNDRIGEEVQKTIADILRSKNVSEEQIKEVTDVLSTAEFARYAPAAAGSKEDLYNATAKLIDNLESTKI